MTDDVRVYVYGGGAADGLCAQRKQNEICHRAPHQDKRIIEFLLRLNEARFDFTLFLLVHPDRTHAQQHRSSQVVLLLMPHTLQKRLLLVPPHITYLSIPASTRNCVWFQL